MTEIRYAVNGGFVTKVVHLAANFAVTEIQCVTVIKVAQFYCTTIRFDTAIFQRLDMLWSTDIIFRIWHQN